MRHSFAKQLKITCPALKLRNGYKAPKTTLIVHYCEHTVGVPWATLRPLIACAFRHVQREAFRVYREQFIYRSMRNNTVLILNNSGSHYWRGRFTGIKAYISIGHRHETPKLDRYPRYKDMPEFWLKDWHEHLVSLVAHELWHRWEPGCGKKAETACEVVASDAVETYRREQGYTFTPPEEIVSAYEQSSTGANTSVRGTDGGAEEVCAVASAEPSGQVPADH